jgi:uncharacterized membrane protein
VDVWTDQLTASRQDRFKVAGLTYRGRQKTTLTQFRNFRFPILRRSMIQDNSTEPTATSDSLVVEPSKYRESHLRTVLKTLSWRIVATTTTIIIAYFVFGDVSRALAVGGIEFIAKMGIYYAHERVWQLVPRGTVREILHHQRGMDH